MEISSATDWGSLCALVLVLGIKHGFDADHLATIDGLTRYNSRRNPILARLCGTLFSLGHGIVVLAIALTVSFASRFGQIPQWFDGFGTLVSIFFLLVLGIANLHAILTAAPHEMVQPVGLKGRWLGSLNQTSSPWLIVLVGVLFALSFDTLSQAALFAVIATRYGGWEYAAGLGLLFIIGMLTVDGMNGLWISHLLRRTDQVALIASRVMGLAVAAISLLVAALAMARLGLSALEKWGEGKELAFGAVVLLVIAGSFVLAMRLARSTARA